MNDSDVRESFATPSEAAGIEDAGDRARYSVCGNTCIQKGEQEVPGPCSSKTSSFLKSKLGI